MTAYCYKRVSSTDQNTARQLDTYEPGFFAHEFVEKISGGSREKREQLQLMIDICGEGDQIYVHSLDRLARNLKDLQEIVETITGKGASIHFEKEGLTFGGNDSAMSKLLLQIFGAVAEFERSLIRERQAEGIAKAKERGAYAVAGHPTLDPAKFEAVEKAVKFGVSISKACRNAGISRQSYYNMKKRETEAEES